MSRLRLAPEALQAPALVLLSALGLGATGALAMLSFDRSTREAIGLVHRLQLWTLLGGWAMYALTRSVVYDRYLLPWIVLLPIVWVWSLPRRAQVIQAVGLVAIQAWYVYRLLIREPSW